jgi:predicted dehydrogenase
MRRQGKRDPKDPRVRVEAARTLIDARNQDEATAMAAFMGIFHPGHPKTDELVREARKKRR